MSIFLLILGLLVLKGIRLCPANEFNRAGYISKEQTRCIEGIFAILVIFSHFKNDFITQGTFDAVYFRFQGHLGQAIVAMFLFYSGFGMMSGIDRKGMDYLKTIPGRFLRLLVRFDIAVVLYAALQLSLGRVYTPVEYLLTLLGWKSIGNSNWYIFAMLCLYVCMYLGFLPFLRKSEKNHYPGLVLFSLLVLGYLVVMKYVEKESWWYNTVVCFVAGAWYYKVSGTAEAIVMRNDKQYFVLLALLAIAYTVASFMRTGRLLYYEIWVLLFTALVLVLSMKLTLKSTLLDFLGSHVFSIYILQRIPMILLKRWGIPQAHPYGALVLVIASTVILAVIFDHMTGKLFRPSLEKQSSGNNQKKTGASGGPIAQVNGTLLRLRKRGFLFAELVKRDFMQKYKRTVLGMWWSVLSPLLSLLVMRLVFMEFFGRNTPHYTTYLFCGNLIFSYFRESTNGGMNALMANRGIITKVNVPKYLFLFSKNVSALINFGLTLCVFFLFAAIDKVSFGFHFLALVYPVFCLVVFNIGMGLILSALFVFFRDIGYLYDIFTMLLMYLSAIFYNVSTFSEPIQKLFLLNPIYTYILYFRTVVLDGVIPPLWLHLLNGGYALLMLGIGAIIYKRNNHKFLYYM